MLAYTYVRAGEFALREKEMPAEPGPRDAVVRMTLASICTSDVHILHGSVPRAVPGITVGHEMVGVVERVGTEVRRVKPGDRVVVNVETFCGSCFFCRNGYVNNCTDPNGGWALGCRIDGALAEYVRVPYADQGLTPIPDGVSDEQALFVGDILATGYWAARISEVRPGDTVLIIGAGPTGICTLACVRLKGPKRIIVCEKSPERIRFVREHFPDVTVVEPEACAETVRALGEHGGADAVLEVAGTEESFRMAWECARPNAVVTVVALYDRPQVLPLPEMYGKNLTFKTGGVDGCDCAAILELIAAGQIDTTPLITHRFPLERIEEAFRLFEGRRDGVIKVAVTGPRQAEREKSGFGGAIAVGNDEGPGNDERTGSGAGRRVLVVGANGFTGRKILNSFVSNADFQAFGCSLRPDIGSGAGYGFFQADIRDPEAVKRLFEAVRPDVVINTAAVSSPDYCEMHRPEAVALNVSAVADLASACEAWGGRFVHLSTDFVFRGEEDRLYTEEDVPDPVNFYGVTKRDGETAALAGCRDAAVARIVVVYGNPEPGQHGNIVGLVADRLRRGEAVRVVRDQWRTPTFVEDVVQGVSLLAGGHRTGIYHLCGADYVSIAGLALRVAGVLGLDASRIEAVTTEAMREQTPRPRFSGLSIAKAVRELGYRPVPLEEGIRRMFGIR